MGCSILTAQNKKDKAKSGVIKTEISTLVSGFNFYQLGYEFNIQEKNSLQIGVGFGTQDEINVYALNIQSRFYLNNWTNSKPPRGFHIGPRVAVIYGESNHSSLYTGKQTAFGFELDGLFGYQFLIGDIVALDPYIGPGVAIFNNQTQFGLILGVTLGVAF